MLSKANISQKFCGETINTATYLQNRLPIKSSGRTSYELLSNNKPNLSYLRLLAVSRTIYVKKTRKGKLYDKVEKGISSVTTTVPKDIVKKKSNTIKN